MYKNILSVGIVLNKEEQLKIVGGSAPDCEGGQLTTPQNDEICIPEFDINCP